jgi:hypothetical protein
VISPEELDDLLAVLVKHGATYFASDDEGAMFKVRLGPVQPSPPPAEATPPAPVQPPIPGAAEMVADAEDVRSNLDLPEDIEIRPRPNWSPEEPAE